MALAFLLDEQLRGPLWRAIQQHNALGVDVLDVLRVGNSLTPPLGTPDPDLLLWCEANGRTLLSEDRRTMLSHLSVHLQAGHHLLGLLILRPAWRIAEVIDLLVLHAQVYDATSFSDQVVYLP